MTAARLYDALRKLRVWESELADLEYPEGDPRRAKHESELPQDWHDERAAMRGSVVLAAALIGGETRADAECFADQPLSETNPYNVQRAQLAAAIFPARRKGY